MKICYKCQKETKVIKRNMCNSCYEYARLHNIFEVQKLCSVEALNNIQMEHITGSMLGDGSIEMSKLAKEARLHILRQSKDIDYLKWQCEVFDNIISNVGIVSSSFFDRRTEKSYLRSYFRSRNCPAITKIWNKWYVNKIKIVPIDLEFTPTILLIWFLDDGSFLYEINKNSTSCRIDLATMGFSETENLLLAQKLSSYIKGEVKVLSSKGKFYIRLNDLSARKFVSIIDSIFPQCMLRKAKWKNNDCDFYTRKILL
jgi:hypothetical protein